MTSANATVEISRAGVLNVTVIGDLLFIRRSVLVTDDSEIYRPVMSIIEGLDAVCQEPISREVSEDATYAFNSREDLVYYVGEVDYAAA